MTDQAQHTRENHTLRQMSDGWHLLHTIHRQIRRMRDGGPLTRDYCVESIHHNSRALFSMTAHRPHSPGVVARSSLMARHLAASVHEMIGWSDPPVTEEHAAVLGAARKYLLASGNAKGRSPADPIPAPSGVPDVD